MKRRLTQSIAGVLLVCMAGSTIFGAASVTRKGAPKPEPTTSAPSTGMPGKAPAKEPGKAPAMPSSPSAPGKAPTMPEPSKTPEPSKAPVPSTKPTTPVVPKPSEKPTTPAAPKPSEKPTTPVAPKPSEKPTTPAVPKPSEKPSTPVVPKPSEKPTTPAAPKPSEKPSMPAAPKPCPNKPATCPNKKPECPNKPKPFALDNFKVIQATLASCGVDEQELAAYIKQGKKLEDVLKAENISVRKFKKRVLKEYCKVINEAVKSGELTNEQGAQLKEAIKDTVKNWLPKK